MLFGILLFIVFVLLMGGFALTFLNKSDRKKKKDDEVKYREDPGGSTAHVEDLFPIEFLEDGIYAVGGLYCGLGKIEGTNFSIMSDHDKDSRESIFIDILTGIDYPIQFVTTNVIANTGHVAREIARKAVDMPEGNLKTYSALYAKALDDMHKERRILSQCSWLVITDDGADGNAVSKLKEKMNILGSSLQQRAGVVFTPLWSMEDALDVFGLIMNNESLVRPSDILRGIQPVHLSEREVSEFVQSYPRAVTAVGG